MKYIIRMLNYLEKKIPSLDNHTLEVIKKSSASLIVKVVGVIAGLGVSIGIGRLLGPDGLGIINFSLKVVNVIVVVGLFGMEQLIIRDIAISRASMNWNKIGNTVRNTSLLSGTITLFLSIIFIVLTPWVTRTLFHEPRLTYPLIVLFLVLVPQVLTKILSSALVGYKKIWQGNFFNQTFSTILTGILLLIFWLIKIHISINGVAILYAISHIIVYFILSVFWRSFYKFKFNNVIEVRSLAKSSLPLLWVSLSAILMANADIIMLGLFGDAKEVGLYSVAARIALLTSFLLQITNSSVSPKIASLYKSGNVEELELMLQRTTKGLLIFGISILIVFILSGNLILSLWGTEFKQAYYILLILGVGQFINLTTGAVGLVLIMTGHERIQSSISIIFLVLNILLNFVLILNFGALGAAIATAFCITTENLIKFYIVNKKLGIKTLKI